MTYVKRTYLLVNALPLRNTTTTQQTEQLIDMLQVENWSYLVVNTTDQTLYVQQLGSDSAVQGASRWQLGPEQFFSSGVRDGLSVDRNLYWSPYVGVQVRFTTAPTSGGVTIYMITREVV